MNSRLSLTLRASCFLAVSLFAIGQAAAQTCNAENPCQLIWDEIARSCVALGDDAPEFCSDYGE